MLNMDIGEAGMFDLESPVPGSGTAYDLAGRRTGVGGSFARTNTPQAASPATYDVNNQLTQWKGASLTYDANGNLTSDGTNTYTWNARNQLVSISGGASASFQYDPFGRRVSKTIGGTTQYLYDGANPVQEIFGSSASANLLTGGVDEYFQRTDSAGARSFLTDALGSTLALADSTGTVQTQYTFEPFGNTSITGAATTNSFAYTGRELDATGLYFYRARYYNPQLQRFLGEDPLGLREGPNLYEYVHSQPADFVDPFGTDKKRRRECHDVYQSAVYGNFVANSILPQLSLFSYLPSIGPLPANGHAPEAYKELPLLIAKIKATASLGAAAAENEATGTYLIALADLGTPLSGTIAAQGEAALSTAALQEFVVVALEEVVAPVAFAGVIAATIQEGYVWAHCW
jgi:RHS repeat-associated protein